MKQSFFNFKIELTWSKLMALLILTDATVIDLVNKSNGQLFMYALPFVVALIGGKQINDAVKEIKTKLTQ